MSFGGEPGFLFLKRGWLQIVCVLVQQHGSYQADGNTCRRVQRQQTIADFVRTLCLCLYLYLCLCVCVCVFVCVCVCHCIWLCRRPLFHAIPFSLLDIPFLFLLFPFLFWIQGRARVCDCGDWQWRIDGPVSCQTCEVARQPDQISSRPLLPQWQCVTDSNYVS